MYRLALDHKARQIVLIAGILLAASLLALVLHRSASAQDSAIQYPENSTTPVATYNAVDPDGSAIESWSLTGDDADDFKIDGGVLSFSAKKGPDYESPMGGGSPGTSNTYSVTVQAIDATKRIGKKEVTVEVTNVEEAGSMRLSAVQPEAGASFFVIDEDDTAAGTQIKDADGVTSTIKWQWAKSTSKTSGFADIDKATSAAYTPKDADNGYYLRVTASYTDKEGPNKSVVATSDYPAQLRPSNNSAPTFVDQDPDTDGVQNDTATRTIAENTAKGMNIGSPLEATDLNVGSKLTYTLGGTDEESFDIDRKTGQLRTKSALNFETKDTYTVIVRATDPSGNPQVGTADVDNSDEITVTINVGDLIEDPQIASVTIPDFVETTDFSAAPLVTLAAAVLEAPATFSRWSLSGPDAEDFAFAVATDPAGALSFKKQPDYEKPADADGDNTYEITLRATDSDSRTGTRDVTVKVTNAEEAGVVTLSPTQHRVGVPITATLKDPDGGVYGVTWQWYNGAVTDPATAIAGATSATYTPKASNVTEVLNATATYRDAAGLDENDTASSTNTGAALRDTRNKAPVFKDSKGNAITAAERSVAENVMGVTTDDDGSTDDATDNVGATIRVDDPNIATGAEGDSLAYTLTGSDSSKFRIRGPDASETGATRNLQIEVKGNPKFDYETKNTYMVTLTVRDDYGEVANLALTIRITDVNDAPEITGPASQSHAENDTGPVATFTAVDPEGSAIASWTLTGDDAGDFKIDGGVLSFSAKKGPDYETPVGGGSPGSSNTYSVTVQATDATQRTGTKAVTVEVTNVDEAGSMRLSAVQPEAGASFFVIDEDDTTAGTQIKDADRITSTIEWQWSKSRSRTSGFGNIDKATNPAYTPKDADNGYYLRVMASYTDREGPNKSVVATSDYPAQLRPSNNSAPTFVDQDPDTDGVQNDTATRTIAENTPKGVDIGSPLEATDLNVGSKLTYTLGGTDEESFDIDRKTGQLRTKSALNFETKDTYTVIVRATDPSGNPQVGTADVDNSDEITVTINVEDLAEDPQIASVTIPDFVETTDFSAAPLVTLAAAVLEAPATFSRWSLSGPDAEDFAFAVATDPAGALSFKKQPDYEKPADADGDNVYEITLRATDSDSRTGTRDVTVKVTNAEEAGVVTLSPTQHRVGVPVTATLKDGDGGVYGVTWQWSIGAGAASTTAGDISGATSATYTPKAGDVGGALNATATYQDAAGGAADDSAVSTNTSVALRDTRNKAPVFEDSKGNAITAAERSVAEDVAGVATDDPAGETDLAADNVGAVIMAQDLNIGTPPAGEGDSLAFSLSGADASKFRLRAATAAAGDPTLLSVQVEVKTGSKFDYETKPTYTMTLTARDDYGEVANLALTIKITDVNDAPVITAGPATGVVISGPATQSYRENGTGAVATYRAAGPNAASATWSLRGTDAGDFTLSGSGSSVMLMFASSPDFESPADANTDNVYMVTLSVRAGSDRATHDVAVTVTDDASEQVTCPTDPLVRTYDTNCNGLEKAEVIQAINDYFDAGPNAPSKADVIRLIGIYLS